MLRSGFFPLRRSKSTALVLPSEQVEREGHLMVRHQVPPHAMQYIAIDAGDAKSLPTQPRRLPRKAVPPPRHDRMEADEQQQVLCHQRSYLDHGLQRDMGGTLRLGSVDHVGIAASDCAHLVWIWAGEDSRGHRWIGKTESARRQKRSAARRSHYQLQRAPRQSVLLSGDLLRVDKLPCGRDQWWCLQELDTPVMRKLLRVFP